MPCKKCKDGKYKYGNTGECKYDTKEECYKANPNKYNKMKEYPTPLGKKTYDEYAKELKEFNLSAVEKIELSSKKEMEKEIQKYQKFIKPYKKLLTELEQATKIVEKAKRLNDDGYKLRNEGAKVVRPFIQNIKDLGLKITEVPIFSEYAKVAAVLDEINSDMLSAISKVTRR